LFIVCELVGFTSYVLIGHLFCRGVAADAANKAFITTRIGDFGFMIGILMVWMATGSIVFAEVAPRMSTLAGHPLFLTTVALLIFCGAVGKSAQFPLHVWLPDAMEGPTPVSPCVLQSAPLSRCRLSYCDASSRTEHLEHGRAFAETSDHIC